MRAAVLESYGGRFEVEDVIAPALGPHDVSMRVDATGVCHSDLTMLSGDGFQFQLPVILGHEAAGVVLETGAEVTALKPGDTVISSWCPQCDACFFCHRGEAYLCERRPELTDERRNPTTRADGTVLSSMASLGTFATQVIADEALIIPVTTDLAAEQLALIGCGVTTGFFAALNTAEVTPGASVAVIGCGGVGLSTIQGARVAGAECIIGVDPVPARREAATAAGATHVVDPANGGSVEQIHAITAGRGADFVFESIGRRDTYIQARAATIIGGTTVYVGMYSHSAAALSFSMADLHRPGRLVGCAYGSANVRTDYQRLIGYVESGEFNLADMVTKTLPLDDINEAVELLEAGIGIRTVLVNP